MPLHPEIIDRVRELAKEIQDEIIALRRTFHQFPELSWKEFKTAERVVAVLQETGLKPESGICDTGVVADILGGRAGKSVAIRADMDALPMQDSKEVSYASRVPEVMHACGHDSHMAMALGVATILKKLQGDIAGRVRFIFQPCEEAFPSGAHELVKAGAMKGVDSIFALHVDPEIDVGKIGLRSGPLTANANEFKIAVFGKSGHAARPHQAIDTVHVANQVMTALYNIIGNQSQSHLPAVLTIGKIKAGAKSNVIAERAHIAGTIRTIDRRSNDELEKVIENRVAAITRAAGAHYQLEFPALIPAVNNDIELVNMIREVCLSTLGQGKVVNIAQVSMGGEDFSWFLDKAPGALIRLGVKKPGDEVRYLHTHSFDIDERAIRTGLEVMSLTVLTYLSN